MKRKLVVVDTETTGFDAATHSILALGAVVYQDGGVVAKFYSLIKENPGVVIESEAEAVNGLSAMHIADAPSPWEVVTEFCMWLAKNELYGQQTLVAHNASFDSAFVKRLFRLAGTEYDKTFSHRTLCTQTAALLLEQAGRITLPGGSSSLDNVAQVFGLTRSTGKHDALEDATLAARVLAKMVDRIK